MKGVFEGMGSVLRSGNGSIDICKPIYRHMIASALLLIDTVNIFKSKIKYIRIIPILLILLFSLPTAMAALTLNAITPAEVDICSPAKFVVYANNTGTTASNLSINVTIPTGFSYDPGSVHITFPVTNHSAQEPVILQQYLNWTNSSWVLGDNQNLKIEFNLTAGCGSPSGKRLAVNAGYSGGIAAPFSSLAVVVNQGLLKVTKEPNVIEASKYDTVKWTVKIENIGSGTAFNVLVNDTNENGLELLSIDSPGGQMNWSYDRIDPGEIKTVNTTFRVMACKNLVNTVNVSWGCSGNYCQKTYAKGSIKYIYLVALVKFTFSPSPIIVPYCNNTTVTVTVNNTGENNATNYQMNFADFSAPYSITNVSGAQYFESNHTFMLGTINSTRTIATPLGGSKTFSFNFGMPYGRCNATGSSGVFNIYSSYYGDCGSRWYPPATQMTYSMDPATIPSISASKRGDSILYLGETGSYAMEVSYSSGNCALHSLPNSTIVDHYPANFEVIDAAGGTVFSGNQTIVWKDEPINDTTPWSKVVQLKASKDYAKCSCGDVYNNEFNVTAGEDCCGCPLFAETSFPIMVKCFNDTIMRSSNKSATPTLQENCRLISYNNTYVFNNTKGVNWSNISFAETGPNGQTFPDGSNSGSAIFTVNHACVNVSTITLNTAKNLDFLNGSCGPLENGTILQINYTLRQPQTGSFTDWSKLCVDGYSPDCPNVGCFQDAVSVAVNQADYGLSMQLPCYVSACKMFPFTINLTKNSPDDDPNWIAHDMNLTYCDINYRYIGPSKIAGIVNQSGPVSDFEPTRVGNNLTWELGQNVSRGGNITFMVQRVCGTSPCTGSWLNYKDNCGSLVARSGKCSPGLERFSNITFRKTPEVVYALDRNASWKIYMTNVGSGIAYNVTAVDYMESDLNYSSSRIRRCPTCPLVAEPENTTVIGHDPCGPDKVIWNIGEMDQQQQVMIEVNATLCGCNNRNNIAYFNLSCGGSECQNVSASSKVELVDARLLVAKHEAGRVDDCKANDPFLIEVINTASNVYNLSIKETLPPGLKLNDTPIVSGAVNTSFDNSNPSVLIWYFNQTFGIVPGTRISIRFNASATGSCSFNGGDSTVLLNYTEPCGRFGPEVESEIPVIKFSPAITITKTPSTSIANIGDIVRWNITLMSEGDYTAKNVTLQDILPTNTIWHSSDPAQDGGSGTSADPLVWNLPDMNVGQSRNILVNATVTGCDIPTNNTARVNWSCCPIAPAVATADLITRPSGSASPDIGQLMVLDTCGGDITLTIANSGATAFVYNISNKLPVGFIYKTNSALITSNNASHNSSITIYEPNDFTAINGTLVWNASNIDRVYPNEIITIKFKVQNCTECCKSSRESANILQFYYFDSCGNLLSTDPDVHSVSPKKGDLVVRKEPAVQFQGPVSWTIYIDNNGNETAKNVSVIDVLGDGFYDVSSSNGTMINNSPFANWTTIEWAGQEVPMGVGKWSAVINASTNETCGLTHINNVTVRGTCDTGCIYSNDSAIARALSQAVFRLDSLESLLRGQTTTISSFESLLKNSSLDANASQKFLASFDDLSMRQQLGLNDFEGIVWCNWNDLEEAEKIKFTASFEDLLRREAAIISSNDVLLIRGYCKLSSSEKAVLLSSYEDRIHSEQYLLNSFNKWLDSQSALNETEQQTWYQFLASYEDLIRRQARLISSFQELLYSSCQGTFMEVYKSTNKTDFNANANDPINYTITVNNTGNKTIENITINDSILGVIQGSPGITLAAGTNRTYHKVVSHNCSYCSSCICRICNFALSCGDVVMDATNRTHLCVASNEVCLNISQPSKTLVYPG
jgi:uncharacterized repeat protein (TIGR01451 family)